MKKSKSLLFSLSSLALLACVEGNLQTVKPGEFPAEVQRELAYQYIAAYMYNKCDPVYYDESALARSQARVTNLSQQAGISEDLLIAHSESPFFMSVEQQVIDGFFSSYGITFPEGGNDFTLKLCQAAVAEDQKNTAIGQLIVIQ